VVALVLLDRPAHKEYKDHKVSREREVQLGRLVDHQAHPVRRVRLAPKVTLEHPVSKEPQEPELLALQVFKEPRGWQEQLEVKGLQEPEPLEHQAFKALPGQQEQLEVKVQLEPELLVLQVHRELLVHRARQEVQVRPGFKGYKAYKESRVFLAYQTCM
jgi:hypothetical protein